MIRVPRSPRGRGRCRCRRRAGRRPPRRPAQRRERRQAARGPRGGGGPWFGPGPPCRPGSAGPRSPRPPPPGRCRLSAIRSSVLPQTLVNGAKIVLELLTELAEGAVGLTLDGADRVPQRLGGFLLRQLVPVPEHEHRALAVGQPEQGPD